MRDRQMQSRFNMFEKMFALTAMIAVVVPSFTFSGAADAGPQAVLAPAPIVATAENADA